MAITCKSEVCYQNIKLWFENFKDTIIHNNERQLKELRGIDERKAAKYQKHGEFLRRITYETTVKKVKGKFVVSINFEKISLVLQLRSRWSCEAFTLGSTKESNLNPQGQSKHLVFQYLTNQLQKIYAFYEAVSEFPIGLLMLMVYQHNLMLFESKDCCPRCHKNFDQSGGPSYGFLPPVFRDMWLRPDQVGNQIHNLCQTCSILQVIT